MNYYSFGWWDLPILLGCLAMVAAMIWVVYRDRRRAK